MREKEKNFENGFIQQRSNSLEKNLRIRISAIFGIVMKIRYFFEGKISIYFV